MSLQTTSVLVIDDNADLAENIAEILEDCGVDVHLASDAQKALERFDDRKWSLVVTDVRMPGLDGIELLSLIKERSPGTPVLVMTGFADRDTIARAHHSGALAVVHKPIDLDAFLELVERVAAAEDAILVVEDDVALCGNLTDILCEQRGVLPHPATSVALARKLAAAIDFKAALIDLRLPDGNGLVLARELHQRPDGSRRPVIVMTGYPEEIDASDESARVRDDLVVLTKPFPVPRLLERLRELV
ncbi:MAG TPA: response regulator [Enhygromyxa sp.]|nr:response regulator [Enhygromyxa sp.]